MLLQGPPVTSPWWLTDFHPLKFAADHMLFTKRPCLYRNKPWQLCIMWVLVVVSITKADVT